MLSLLESYASDFVSVGKFLRLWAIGVSESRIKIYNTALHGLPHSTSF